MHVMFLVLNKVDCLEELLVSLADSGVKGGTIIESTGMARALGDSDDANILGSLRMLFDPEREESKTLFFVLEDEMLPVARDIINKVTGGLDKPDSGIIFTIPIDNVEGLRK